MRLLERRKDETKITDYKVRAIGAYEEALQYLDAAEKWIQNAVNYICLVRRLRWVCLRVSCLASQLHMRVASKVKYVGIN